MIQVTLGILLAIVIVGLLMVVIGAIGYALTIHEMSGFWPWSKGER